MAQPTPIPPTLTPATLDTIRSIPSLSYALTNVVQKAAERSSDGQRIYGPIATFWEEYVESDAVRKLPERLRYPLICLCKDISATANRHFDAYLKGSHPPRPNKEASAPAPAPALAPAPAPIPSSIPSTATTSAPRTYAQATTTTFESTSRGLYLAKKQLVRTTNRPDTRLFVRIAPDHDARKVGAYAMLGALKKQLHNHAHLLKEVQAVKTGYALCTDSIEDLADLNKFADSIASKIGDCTIEKQVKWITYRVDNIPRTVRTLLETRIVDAKLLTDEIADSTGEPPARVVETAQSVQDGLFNTSWFVSFVSESHVALNKNLRILGVRAVARLVTFKPKISQCTKCFQWHNTRVCSRVQRCRTCGSNEHTENSHTTRCTTAKPHSCPARCLHCGGPHPADDRNCPLRLTHKGPPTKSLRVAVQSVTRAARKRACAAAGCSKVALTDIQMEDGPHIPSPTTPTTPTRARNVSSPTSTNPSAVRFRPATSNSFAPLAGLTDRLQLARGAHQGL